MGEHCHPPAEFGGEFIKVSDVVWRELSPTYAPHTHIGRLSGPDRSADLRVVNALQNDMQVCQQ